MDFIPYLMFIMLGFVSGSVMYSKIIPKRFAHKDVCELSDDGNPGAFNAFAHCGKKLGALCLLADVLKAFVPIFAATFFLDTSNYAFGLVMFAPVLGHAVGAFNGFHGGKCIASSFGAMFGIIHIAPFGLIILAVLYILFAAIIRIKSNRICSIIVYSLFLMISVTVMNLSGYYAIASGCALIAATAIIKHARAVTVVREDAENEECNV